MAAPTARDQLIRFAPFALDAANARLYRGDQVISLRGKTFAVLEYLTARPGQLVTKDELLKNLWPEVYVSEDVLVGCVRELRSIFGDSRGAPRFVETVYRRGYRWIAQLSAEDRVLSAESQIPLSTQHSAPGTAFVGREADLAELQRWFDRAARGARQVVFVAGEAGIGKTALVDEFLRLLAARLLAVRPENPNHLPPNNLTTCLIARGQCVEQYGPAEPYLPLLDALVRLSRQPGNAWAAARLERCLPEGLLSPSADTAAAGAIMPERAVRLLAGAVEALASEGPFVLVLEDLHWSDPSTLDVLSYVAQRPEPCRLLVLATYRPTEAILRRHPLRGLEQQLHTRRHSTQLSLGRLTVDSVRSWLEARCPSPPQALVEWVHGRTDGHPLFLVMLFEALVAAGLIACDNGQWTMEAGYADFGVPESLRLMIDRQTEHLDHADRLLLEAASVAGTQFSAASVAAAVEQDLVFVEQRCSALARAGQFVCTTGAAEWPDGTVAGSYQFVHELYRTVLYEGLSPAGRRLLHQRIGHRLEQAYGRRADELATELSVHFEQGRDPARAIAYLEKALTHCNQRGAHREAVAVVRRALEMAALLPDTPERTDQMLHLNLRLGASLLVAEDYADPAVEAAFQRSVQLAEKAQAPGPLLTALGGLHASYAARAQLAACEAIVPRALELAEQLPLPQSRLIAYACAAWSQWARGDLETARASALAAIATQPDEPIPFPTTFDIVSYVLGISAFVEMALGHLTEARARAAQAEAWSRKTARPVDRATALTLIGMLCAFMSDPVAAAAQARAAVAVAQEHGHRQWLALAGVIAAWADATEERSARALTQLTRRIGDCARMGLTVMHCPFLCLAAGAYLRAGKEGMALESLAQGEAHIRDTGERWYEPEMHRLRGVAVQAREPRKAEANFQRAIDIARTQGAKFWELRAAVGLAMLWRQERKRDAARRLLEPILSSFATDADAFDLQTARALRARLL
jgi:DNA-binding winged helix-turn-helix (wHTH) protein/tetratricopeptide (TPR) repeat protein